MAPSIESGEYGRHASRLAQQAYSAFSRRDLTSLGELLKEDVSFSWRGPVGTTTGSGRHVLLGALAELVNLTKGTAEAELRHVYADAQGRVVCVHRESASMGGRQRTGDSCMALTIADGRIAALVQLDERPPPAVPLWRPDVFEDP